MPQMSQTQCFQSPYDEIVSKNVCVIRFHMIYIGIEHIKKQTNKQT